MDKQLIDEILDRLTWLRDNGTFFHSAIEFSSFNNYGGDDFEIELKDLIDKLQKIK